MPNDHFNETWRELEAGVKVKDHPFRVCTLATFESANHIKQRVVNLREVTRDNTLLFYTDSRSGKIDQIKKNSNASALFYNQNIYLQVFVRGIITIHENNDLWQDHFFNIEGRSVHDYNTKYAPGKKIKNPLEVIRTENINFAVLEMVPHSIEYLKLRAEPNRLRALFNKKDGVWEKTFLIP